MSRGDSSGLGQKREENRLPGYLLSPLEEKGRLTEAREVSP